MSARYAILLDGGFVTKALAQRLKQPATAANIAAETARLRAHPIFAAMELLRIYYYDAPPGTSALANPIDGSTFNLGTSKVAQHGLALLAALDLDPDFAVRRGETVVRGWKIGNSALKSMLKNPRVPTARDLVPNVQQKGVDLRIALDIAQLSLRQLVQAIAVVSGDSDLIPAFKFARREGMRVYLDHLGMPIRRELLIHADIVI